MIPEWLPSVAVRELCEFTAKSGDLDHRFTPAPSAQEGIAGHAVVASRRGPDYQREIALQALHGPLRVRGRADGYDPALNRIEEVKTHRGPVERVPENHRRLHWAQLRIYAAMLCRERGLSNIVLALVYFDVDRGSETLAQEDQSAESLNEFFAGHAQRYLDWLSQQRDHENRRSRYLTTLTFPFPDFNAGQRELSRAVYRAAARRTPLMIEAPTGIGKTLGVLFGSLKACGTGTLDKLFYLTARTTGRKLASDALRLCGAGNSDSPVPLRMLELIARDKACVYPGRACTADECPRAKGFYDRLPAARAEAAHAGFLDQDSTGAIAERHGICPYYLSQEMVRWSDVIIADYNYYFDAGALLHALATINEWRISVLVDEAHNLVERGRAMYSAELDRSRVLGLRAATQGSVKRRLDELEKAWTRLQQNQEVAYCTLEECPPEFVAALRKLILSVAELQIESPTGLPTDLLHFYFDVIGFCRLVEAFGPHSLFESTLRGDLRPQQPDSVLGIRNVVPAPFFGPRFASAANVVLFSATLQPAPFYRDLLGLDPSCTLLNVASPFSPDQLSVTLVSGIPTRFREREASVPVLTAFIAQTYHATPGNYLVFAGSFAYLESIWQEMTLRHPAVPCWRQVPGMKEDERTAFLGRFATGGSGIGFAVLGGAFGEGIDLPGTRLIGAFIATLGLPQINHVNEEIRLRLEALLGQGFEYTYLYPGLRKVVQAAGRVVRSIGDRGSLYLIDDRYRRPEIRRLLPSWWEIRHLVAPVFLQPGLAGRRRRPASTPTMASLPVGGGKSPRAARTLGGAADEVDTDRIDSRQGLAIGTEGMGREEQ